MVSAFSKLVLVPSLLLCCFNGLSQEIKNQTNGFFHKDGTNYNIIRIKFNLESKDNNIPYITRLKFIDKKIKKSYYLKKITGDFNTLIYTGPGKQIDWDQNDELVYYRGSPDLELEVAPALQADRKVKRGRNMIVLADPLLLSDDTYTLTLYKKKSHFGTMEENVKLNAINSINIPKKLATKKYQLAYVKDGKAVVISNTFKVKPRVATFWKVVPFVIGAGVLGYLWYDKNTAPLPLPPDPKL